MFNHQFRTHHHRVLKTCSIRCTQMIVSTCQATYIQAIRTCISNTVHWRRSLTRRRIVLELNTNKRIVVKTKITGHIEQLSCWINWKMNLININFSSSSSSSRSNRRRSNSCISMNQNNRTHS